MDSSSAFFIAPVIPNPSSGFTNTSSAPNALSIFLRSMLMLSGIVRISLYPFTAATKAKPIPVFPDVGSTRVSPGFIFPSFSAVSIIDNAILSLTELIGLNDSSFTYIVAESLSTNLFILTTGVSPINSSILFATFAILSPRIF